MSMTMQPSRAIRVESYPVCDKQPGSSTRSHLHSHRDGSGETVGTVRELQKASRRKDEFLAILGHELRNPLAPILTAMQIVRVKGAADPELVELAEMVERQIQQLSRLIEDLVDVSRVGQGKMKLQWKLVDLRTVAALAVEMSRPLIDARKHVLTVSVPDHAVEVEGDAGRLMQVVSNLLNNSAKYSDDGGRIELTLSSVDDQAVLRVRDSGIGIEPAMLPGIFDLFTQVNCSTSRSDQGLGIGLALVRKLIDVHGGGVRAVSAGLGHGTEFVVCLPLLRKVPADCHIERGGPRSVSRAPTRRMLVVDDNRDAADSLATLLRFDGHEVRTAYDGQTALALARSQTPEVVICDIAMPGMGGFELAHHLRHELALQDAFMVAVSGYSQEEDRHRAQDAGFNAHLTKPMGLDNLKAILANADLLTSASPPACRALELTS